MSQSDSLLITCFYFCSFDISVITIRSVKWGVLRDMNPVWGLISQSSFPVAGSHRLDTGVRHWGGCQQPTHHPLAGRKLTFALSAAAGKDIEARQMRLVNNKCRKVKCQQKVSSERLKSPHTGICQSHRTKCHKLRKTLHKIITSLHQNHHHERGVSSQSVAAKDCKPHTAQLTHRLPASSWGLNPILQPPKSSSTHQPSTQSSNLNLNLNPILQPLKSASSLGLVRPAGPRWILNLNLNLNLILQPPQSVSSSLGGSSGWCSLFTGKLLTPRFASVVLSS